MCTICYILISLTFAIIMFVSLIISIIHKLHIVYLFSNINNYTKFWQNCKHFNLFQKNKKKGKPGTFSKVTIQNT